MVKPYEHDDEHRDLAREWRARVTSDLNELAEKVAKLEAVYARALGWVCGVQFVGMVVIGIVEFFLKR